jgi:hypothetical protein
MQPGEVFPFLMMVLFILAAPLIYFCVHTIDERSKDKVRRMYARMIEQKLDIIKTAIAMGYSDEEVSELDKRLSRVVGSEEALAKLKTAKLDEKEQEEALLDPGELEEIELLKAGRKQEEE